CCIAMSSRGRGPLRVTSTHAGSHAATTEVPHKADRIAAPPFSPASLYISITVSSDIRQVLRQGYSWISVAQRQSKVRLSAGGPKNGGSYGHFRRACHVQRAGH